MSCKLDKKKKAFFIVNCYDLVVNGVNKNQWEWKIHVQARQYNLFVLYFMLVSFNIRRDYMV